MNDSNKVLVDSNVVIDIAGIPGEWTQWSTNQLRHFSGGLVINPIIYSELCSPCDSATQVEVMIDYLGLDFQELPRQSLFMAAQAFKVYRQRGGVKTSPLPDFFIGAHAAVLDIPILTRDVSRYRTYFPQVELICP